MQPGCGLKIRKIGKQWYLYVWHYENGGSRSRRIERYIGPAKSLKARSRALQALLENDAKALQELDRRIESYRAAL